MVSEPPLRAKSRLCLLIFTYSFKNLLFSRSWKKHGYLKKSRFLI